MSLSPSGNGDIPHPNYNLPAGVSAAMENYEWISFALR